MNLINYFLILYIHIEADKTIKIHTRAIKFKSMKNLQAIKFHTKAIFLSKRSIRLWVNLL